MHMKKENIMNINALEIIQLETSILDAASATTFTTGLMKLVSTVGLYIRCIDGHT
jgi:hypothetical protein